MKKDKEIRVTGVSPQLKSDLYTICDKLHVPLSSLFKIEGRQVIKEINPKQRINYAKSRRDG